MDEVVKDKITLSEIPDADGVYEEVEVMRKFILTSGDTVRGMSGAPVFNGCGLSGISASAVCSSERTTANTNVMWMLGTQVTHVNHLIELVHSRGAADFAFHTTNPKICKVPIKEYCKLCA